MLKAWIDRGAEWDSGVALSAPAPAAKGTATEKKFTAAQRNFWAFQKIAKPGVPPVKAKDWIRTPVDAFILAKLEEKNLKPNPPADKLTLVRRAYFDLVGLPPTPEQVQAFLSDNSPQAFEKVVDRAAGFAALRRALGAPLAGPGPLRRHAGIQSRRDPAQRLALSRLRH